MRTNLRIKALPSKSRLGSFSSSFSSSRAALLILDKIKAIRQISRLLRKPNSPASCYKECQVELKCQRLSNLQFRIDARWLKGSARYFVAVENSLVTRQVRKKSSQTFYCDSAEPFNLNYWDVRIQDHCPYLGMTIMFVTTDNLSRIN